MTSVIREGKEEDPAKGLHFGGDRPKPPPDVHRWMVYCLDWHTGKVLWETEAHKGVPEGPHHVKNTYASETPVTDGERLYGRRSMLPRQGDPDAGQKHRIRRTAHVDWDKLAQAWKYNAAAEGASGLLVLRGGFIVGEWYRDCDRARSGSRFATTSADGVRVWDLATGTNLLALSTTDTDQVSWSEDGGTC